MYINICQRDKIKFGKKKSPVERIRKIELFFVVFEELEFERVSVSFPIGD